MKWKLNSITTLLFILFNTSVFAGSLSLKDLQLPPGFSIAIYADNVKNAREMALGDKGTVFVGSNSADKVYAIVTDKKDPQKHDVITLASDLNQPTGVAFYKGDLYIAEVHRIIRFPNIENHLADPPKPEIITRDFPLKKSFLGRYIQRHGWKYIAFGPDGWLYITVGVPCDACLLSDKRYGTIMRMKPDGSDAEIYAKGIRNSVGIAWHPITKQLWFTDNGSDAMGDSLPGDRLSCATQAGLDFGFPYYEGKDKNGNPVANSKFIREGATIGITWPKTMLPAHVAALGLVFYNGKMFPKDYQNQIIIAEHGSWVPKKKVGYKLSLIKLNGDDVISYQPFVTGWMKDNDYWGRPVALLELPDGSLLVSDDYASVIYRITYQ